MVATFGVISQVSGFRATGSDTVLETTPINETSVAFSRASLPFYSSVDPASQGEPTPGAVVTIDNSLMKCDPDFDRVRFVATASPVLPADAAPAPAPSSSASPAAATAVALPSTPLPNAATPAAAPDAGSAPKVASDASDASAGDDSSAECATLQQPVVAQAASGPELAQLLRLPAQEVCNQVIDLSADTRYVLRVLQQRSARARLQ